MKKMFLLMLLFIIMPNSYSQNNEKIKPSVSLTNNTNLPYPFTKWGYIDLLNNWLITPQFVEASNFDQDNIATVVINIKNTYYKANIDINGDVLNKYQQNDSQSQIKKKHEQALKIASKREKKGAYIDMFARLAQTDTIIALKKQKEKARQDSITISTTTIKNSSR